MNCAAPWVCLAVLSCVSGCASYHRRLEPRTVAKIVPGTTAQAEVLALIGTPAESMTGAQGVTVTRHFFHQFQPSTDASRHERRQHPGDILLRTLTLKYTGTAIVDAKLHDESLTPVYRTNAWLFAGPSLTTESMPFLVRNETSEAELITRLGEPAARTFGLDGSPAEMWFGAKARYPSSNQMEMRKLVVFFDERRIVRDFIIVQRPLSGFEPFTLN
jgi:hypothetical protein